MKPGLFATVLLAGLARAATSGAASCDSLATLKLSDATVTVAKLVPAGAFTPPARPSEGPASPAFGKAPEFCRVALVLRPTADSDIKVEVWMPSTGWNGRFQGQGNGGFAGAIDYSGMAGVIANGYATAGTDTGHTGDATDAKWALGHPEKVNDFGWRAIHLMTTSAKGVIQAFYGSAPSHSYFASCSDGGREALMEAQRFPADYDGIIAGAPANYWTHLLAKAAGDVHALQADPASYIPAKKLPAISAAVLEACDASDGVKDGILNSPPACHFDPAVLLCKNAESDSCLTAAQIAALKTIYSPLRNGEGQAIFPGYEPGGELGFQGWALWITGQRPSTSLMYAFATNYFSNMVYGDPAWDYRTFKVDSDVAAAIQKTAHALNATDPNLGPFRARGGKLILYHGWNDAAIPPLNTVNYYTSVMRAMRSRGTDFVQLYMAPGMQHCGGGPGPDSFHQFGPRSAPEDPQHDMSAALEQWVEKNVLPGPIIAAKHGKPFDPTSPVTMTRPLCPWPSIAQYKATGDTNDAANFTCAARAK